MIKTLLSAIVWMCWSICIIAYFFIVSVLYVLTFPFDRYNQIPNRALKGLGWMMLKGVPGWKFEIKGANLHKIDKPTIVVANHQSFLDMPLTYLLPWSMKWVAKKSLFKVPVLGWIIFMTGHIGIDRESRRSLKKLDELVKPIQQGIPGMIFPEGTRTQNGALRNFKNGAFMLAKRYNFQILPIVLNGGFQTMPSGSWKLNFHKKFTLSVLEPVDPDDFDSQDSLKKHIYFCIQNELKSLQAASI